MLQLLRVSSLWLDLADMHPTHKSTAGTSRGLRAYSQVYPPRHWVNIVRGERDMRADMRACDSDPQTSHAQPCVPLAFGSVESRTACEITDMVPKVDLGFDDIYLTVSSDARTRILAICRYLLICFFWLCQRVPCWQQAILTIWSE